MAAERYLLWTLHGETKPLDDEVIWIKEPDGSVYSMTYAEFRAHSETLKASRPLPGDSKGRG